MGREEVRHLRRVDAGPATEADKAVHLLRHGEVGGLLQGLHRRLDADTVVDDAGDARRLDGLPHALGDARAHDAGIRDEHRAPHAEAMQFPSRLIRRARPELDRRHLQREDRFVRALLHCLVLPYCPIGAV